MRDQHIRLLRASVVTVVILVLSAGAHVIAGGSLPPAGILLALASVTMLAVTASARRAMKLPALTAVLCGGQLVLHHAFGLLSTAATCVPVSTHLHHGPDHEAMSCAVGPLATHQSVTGGIGAAMLAAHLAATLATAVLIARGEEALHATAAWLRPLFTMIQPAGLPPLPRITIAVHEYRLVAAPFLVAPPLRGPPAFH